MQGNDAVKMMTDADVCYTRLIWVFLSWSAERIIDA